VRLGLCDEPIDFAREDYRGGGLHTCTGAPCVFLSVGERAHAIEEHLSRRLEFVGRVDLGKAGLARRDSARKLPRLWLT
jgi:hypothetical protein